MANILIVGCGDLGSAIAQRLVGRHAVIGLRRQLQNQRWQAQQSNLRLLQGDVTDPASLHTLHAIKPEMVIYCVAADAQTDAAYQAQYVTGLANVLATQQANPALRWVFFVSSTRVYGAEAGEYLDESSPVRPNDFGGQRLLEAEQLLANLACPSTILRLSGLYGPGRLRMINMAASQSWPQQNGWSNRIHRDDAAAFTAFLLEQALAGQSVAPCYIVSDNTPAPVYEVLAYLADQLQVAKLPCWQAPPSAGKRLCNDLLRASGFTLRYPDYQSGYQALLAPAPVVNG